MNQTIAKLWKMIDIKNASLSTHLATKLNPSLIKEPEYTPLPVRAFAFPNEIPTFPNFLRTIESQTNLKEVLELRQGPNTMHPCSQGGRHPHNPIYY